MVIAENSADLQDVCIPARKQGYIRAEMFGYGRERAFSHQQADPNCAVQNDYTFHYFTKVYSSSCRSLLSSQEGETDCETSLHLSCAITEGWLFWEKINA